MRIRWTNAAAADLQGISDYLKEHHPGGEGGTGKILYPPMPYVTVYRVRENTIEIVRIYHTAQNRP